MDCVQLIMATQIILRLEELNRLPQVILWADKPLVEMTIRSFDLPWEVVREDGEFTTVRKRE